MNDDPTQWTDGLLPSQRGRRAWHQIRAGLEMAAESWFEEMGDDELRLVLSQPYSTADNAFLVAAEAAFLNGRRILAAELSQRDQEAAAELAKSPEVPDQAWGVYVLIGPLGEPFYVGMTGRPQQRLARHRREFGENVSAIHWNPAETRREALELETALIGELRPRMNIAKVQS